MSRIHPILFARLAVCSLRAMFGVGSAALLLTVSAARAAPSACSPVGLVTSTLDSGAGSLRQAVLDACPAGTIYFDGSLTDATIALTGS